MPSTKLPAAFDRLGITPVSCVKILETEYGARMRSLDDWKGYCESEGVSSKTIHFSHKGQSVDIDAEQAFAAIEAAELCGELKKLDEGGGNGSAARLHAANIAQHKAALADGEAATRGWRRVKSYKPDDPDRDDSDFGRETPLVNQLRAIIKARQGQWDKRLEGCQTKAAHGMTEGTGADGGFTVNDLALSNIIASADEMQPWVANWDRYELAPGQGNNVIRPVLADQDRSTGEVAGVKLVRTAEGGDLTEDKLQFRARNEKVGKAGVIVTCTNELLHDSAIGMERFVTQQFARMVALDRAFNFLSGDGVAKPQGIIGHAATYSQAKETSPATQTTGTIKGNNLIKMLSHLEPGAHPNAVWLSHISCFPQLVKCFIQGLTDAGTAVSAGNLVWSQNISGRTPQSLFGMPLYYTECAPQVGTVGDITVFDPGAYWYISMALRVDVSEHFRYGSDEISFRVVLRDAGGPARPSTLIDRKSWEVASFCSLATR